jgi:hypothetical protein
VSDQLHTLVKETDILSTGCWLSKEMAWAFAEERKISGPVGNPTPYRSAHGAATTPTYQYVNTVVSPYPPILYQRFRLSAFYRGPKKIGKLKK